MDNDTDADGDVLVPLPSAQRHPSRTRLPRHDFERGDHVQPRHGIRRHRHVHLPGVRLAFLLRARHRDNHRDPANEPPVAVDGTFTIFPTDSNTLVRRPRRQRHRPRQRCALRRPVSDPTHGTLEAVLSGPCCLPLHPEPGLHRNRLVHVLGRGRVRRSGHGAGHDHRRRSHRDDADGDSHDRYGHHPPAPSPTPPRAPCRPVRPPSSSTPPDEPNPTSSIAPHPTAQDPSRPTMSPTQPASRLSRSRSQTTRSGRPSELVSGRYVLAVTTPPTPTASAPGSSRPRATWQARRHRHVTQPGRLPSWYDEATLAGGATSRAGAMAAIVVDLPAGHWILWTGDRGPLSLRCQSPSRIRLQSKRRCDRRRRLTVTATERALIVDGTLGPVCRPSPSPTPASSRPHCSCSRCPEGTTEEQVTDVLTGDVAPFGRGRHRDVLHGWNHRAIDRRHNLVPCQPRSGNRTHSC